MKRILLMLIAGSCFLEGQSQMAGVRKNWASTRKAEEYHAVATILGGQMAPASAKTTATKKRLVGYSYVANGTLTDSNYHIYSGSRGSTHPHLYSYFDNYSPYIYGDNYINDISGAQYIKADLTVKLHNSNGSLELVEKKTYTYDQQDKVISHLDSNTGWYYMRSDLSYTTSGALANYIVYDTFGGTPLIQKSNTYVTHNAQGLRVQDSTVWLATGTPVSKIEFAYDLSGNLTGKTYYYMDSSYWQLSGALAFKYDNNNRLISFVSQYNYLGDMYNSWKDSFTYAGSNPQFDTYRSYAWNEPGNTWVPYSMEIDKTNLQGVVDTYYLYTWNASFTRYDTTEKDYVVYDNDNLAQSTGGLVYLGNGQYNPLPYDRQTWYYESYIDLAVEQFASSRELVVYPNPSGSSIRLNGAITGPAILEIYDPGGKLVSIEKTYRSGMEIDISKLPAGSYFLKLKESASAKSYYCRFTKL